ncbi:hypothetical protein [Anaeromyxobacter soli]|uniref:hypothetical protein n=1 Tax=Anaeromyxobacter soli TaxID=2922725 RepID=UPI001FAF0680|nr:hypothetical protein [Anaeromyxobacter sp. SG29]
MELSASADEFDGLDPPPEVSSDEQEEQAADDLAEARACPSQREALKRVTEIETSYVVKVTAPAYEDVLEPEQLAEYTVHPSGSAARLSPVSQDGSLNRITKASIAASSAMAEMSDQDRLISHNLTFQ